MGETARMWKTYLAESAKVDADKVANWTDALDVLLVFVSFNGVLPRGNANRFNIRPACFLLSSLRSYGRPSKRYRSITAK